MLPDRFAAKADKRFGELPLSRLAAAQA